MAILVTGRDVYGVKFSIGSLVNPTIEVTGPTPIASVQNPVRAGITIVTKPGDNSDIVITSLDPGSVAHTFRFIAVPPGDTATLHHIDTTVNSTPALCALAAATLITNVLSAFVRMGTRQENDPIVSGSVTFYVADRTGGDNASFATKAGGDSATSIIIKMWKAGKERVCRLETVAYRATTAANFMTLARTATPITGEISSAVVPVPHDPISPASMLSAKSISTAGTGGGLVVATYKLFAVPALEMKDFDFLGSGNAPQGFQLRTPMEFHTFTFTVAEAIQVYLIYSESE